MTTTIKITERVEMAHRLHLSKGQCSQLHGHSWFVTVEIQGDVNVSENGMVIDFSRVKKILRGVLATFDHSVLLGKTDPLAESLERVVLVEPDATTEVFAREVFQRVKLSIPQLVSVTVQETPTNMASYSE